MTLDSKQDLDGLLRRWPALAPGQERGIVEHEDNTDWEARADAIVRAATAAAPFEATVLAALAEPPALSAEGGEPESDSARGSPGEKKMSQENGSGGSSTSQESSNAPRPSSPERKRPSLKSIAERASQAGSRPSATPSSSGRSSAPELSPSTPSPPRPAAASRPAIPSAPVSRPVEASGEDSGVINLKEVNASATPEQVAAAEKAKPGAVSLLDFDDDKPAAAVAAATVAEKSTGVVSIAAKAKPPKKSNGAVAGLAIAALGLAAAFAIMKAQTSKQPEVSSVATTTPSVMAEAKTAAPALPEEAPSPIAVNKLAPTVEATVAPGKADTPRIAATSPGGVAATATAAAKEPPPADAVDEKIAAAPKAVAPSSKDGDLHSAIAQAVGAQEPEKAASAGTPEPAAGNPKGQSIPEQPAQGSVASAVNAVMGGAKACVSGADDVSRANVTFSSNGTVTSVTVTGWAAANGKADCIKAAVKGAQVGPFSKPSYTVPMTIRP